MKNLITLLVFTIISVTLFSQAPALIPYQAIARDAAGQPYANSALNARFTLHDIAATGTVVWQELQTVSTSVLGLFTAQLGSSVSLANVNWASGDKFMQVELDLGNGFVDIGTQQLMSVPYALYSGEAANGISGISLTGDTLYLSNGTYVIVPGISAANGPAPLYGCTSSTACNYNSTATQDDGSCYFIGSPCNDGNSSTFNDAYNGSCACAGELMILGCTSSTACNYNSTATQDDGSCYFIGSPCDDGNSSTFSDVYNASCICEGSTGTIGAAHSCGAQNVHNPNLTYGSMTDQEGNSYKTIVIGTQEWMAENLNTSIYRNGDSIPTGLSNDEWLNTINTQQGAWAYNNNDASYACPYGKLYNWYACVDPRGLCPTGWHVPSDGEWNLLVNTIDPNNGYGGEYSDIAGIAMKSAGTIDGGDGYWYAYDSSVEGTNSSGFSGLPGGYRFFNGGYGNVGYFGDWWSGAQYDSNVAWFRSLYYNGTVVGRNVNDAHFGFSVRCLRD